MSRLSAAVPSPERTFPIRTVCTLTGVNPITLRAWERRYGLVEPLRTAGGQRQYTQADIDTVHRVLALMANGVAVGQAREALGLAAAEAPANTSARNTDTAWRRCRAGMRAAIEQFDEARLDQLYGDMLSLHPIERVTQEVLLPLLADMGDSWRGRRGGIAEEHFFAVYLRNKLGARFHHRGGGPAGLRLMLACMPGEHHETGLLVFALAAHARGFSPVLLGADLPLDELAYATSCGQAAAVVISGAAACDSPTLAPAMARLVKEVGVPVFVGGQISVHQHDLLAAAGAVCLGTDVAAGLLRIEKALLRPTSRVARNSSQ